MSREHEFVDLLEEARRGRRTKLERTSLSSGSSGHAWRGGLADRVRVAHRLPQAVLKISSHNSGSSRVRARLRYISRQGGLSIETDEGITLDSVEEVDRLVEDWAADFSTRTNSRDAMSLVVSLPAGTDEKAAMASAREFFAETFAENHEYAFAGHDDTDHFHVHLVVKTRGRDGKAMRATRRDPQRWRQAFAEKARAHGIELDASPRYARGEGRRTPPTAVVQLRRRGEVPRMDQLAAKDAVQRARRRTVRPTTSETVIRNINARERRAFAEQAVFVALEAKAIKDDSRRLKALDMASALASFAEGMPVPQSRMEAMQAVLAPHRHRAGTPETPASVRKLVKQTERAIRDQVSGFASKNDQRCAIAARSRLSTVLRERDRDLER